MQGFEGLEHLDTSVAVLDAGLRVSYVNPSFENLLDVSGKSAIGQRFGDLFVDAADLERKLQLAIEDERGFSDEAISLTRPGHESRTLNCVVTPVDADHFRLMIELRHIEKRLRVQREEQQQTQLVANRELIRNLAHEIKNPLGGIRGAAQLLAMELQTSDLGPELTEYTQVIVHEVDRLQALVDRLLAGMAGTAETGNPEMKQTLLDLGRDLPHPRDLPQALFGGQQLRVLEQF